MADDLALRDGTTPANPPTLEYLYGAFAESWKVRPDDSLFAQPEATPVTLIGSADHSAHADFM
jgi:hypothetical protein